MIQDMPCTCFCGEYSIKKDVPAITAETSGEGVCIKENWIISVLPVPVR